MKYCVALLAIVGCTGDVFTLAEEAGGADATSSIDAATKLVCEMADGGAITLHCQ